MTNPITHHDEQAQLESALNDPDRLLLESLRLDERRRRRRRTSVSLLIGGLVMFTTVMAMLAGWLTLAPPPLESPPSAASSVAQAETKEAWVQRLKGLRDHMHTAFGVGPDLTLLDPDRGLEIVRQAWPQISEPDVKTGLLKTFAFSKALPKKHPKLFQVLDLGMKDPDPKIRAYAASYLSEYSHVDFKDDPQGYAGWFEKFGEKTPDEVLAIAGSSDTIHTNAQSPLSESDKIAKAEELTKEGWQLWSQTSYDKAERKFAEAVALDPAATNAWNGLGWSRFNGGNPPSAVEAFEKCIALAPNHPAALNGLGQIALNYGDYAEGEKYLKLAAPEAPAAWFGLGRLYLLTGKYADARRWITKALRDQPNDPTLKRMLAAANDKKLPADLKRQIEPSGKHVEDSAATLNAKGWQQFFGGNYRSAEATFREILKSNPDHEAAMNGLGFCLLNQGNATEAKPYFEKILAKEPDAGGPLNGLARCLKAEGKLDAAIAVWERAFKVAPGPNDIAAGLAMAYLEKGEKAKALPLLEMLVKANPDNEHFKKSLDEARHST